MIIRTIFSLTILIFCYTLGVARTKVVTVFRSGSDSYNTFRIPAIINLPNGELIAFAEGRVKNSGDFGDIDLVMKRSTDHGKSWSQLVKVVDAGSLQAGNPAPVVDLTDPNYPKGRIFLFYNTGNNHEGEVLNGRGLREVWYITSTDNGFSWSKPINITSMVHKPKQPQINQQYDHAEDWRSYANTPGHALQFLSGPFRGRLYIAANHSERGSGDRQQYFAHGFYSDDHGNTFRLSQTVPIEGGNESTAAELPNGKLLLNSRNQKGDIRSRIVAISNDGGATWSKVCYDKNLPDPVCQGTLLNIRNKKGIGKLLAFCNNDDQHLRNKLTLRLSVDEGETWTSECIVDQNPDASSNTDFTAYNDMVQTDRRHIGILYERERYQTIVFKTISINKKNIQINE